MKRAVIIALLLFSCLTHARQEAGVRFGVLGLFHARQIVISPVAGRTLVCSTADGVRLSGPLHLQLARTKMRISEAEEISAGFLACDDGAGAATEFAVAIAGRIARRYLGRLEITPQARELGVVVTMDLETAVASIVAAESPPHAPMEALKAQAVATRSFLVAGKGRHNGFDFCDTTHCQFLREPPGPATPAFQAAAATRGLVLAYKDEVFAALYSASCGGRTHSLEELGIPVRGYPYFAVTCNYCLRHPEKWVSRITSVDAADLAPTEQSRLKLARKLGWKTVPGNAYAAHAENGMVVLEGVGVGHGIGLCQRGGVDMARQGASFLEILAYYYPNTVVKQY